MPDPQQEERSSDVRPVGRRGRAPDTIQHGGDSFLYPLDERAIGFRQLPFRLDLSKNYELQIKNYELAAVVFLIAVMMRQSSSPSAWTLANCVSVR